MTTRLLICLTLCSLYTTGCLSGTTGKTEPSPTPVEPVTPASLADLHLSLAKPSYSPNEPIPLDMTIQMGKFDLLVPYAAVTGRGAFSKLVVKDRLGQVISPKPPITFPAKTKTVMWEDKVTSCIQGIELKTGESKKASLKDLKPYYKLGPGDYTLQVLMELKVYREIFAPESPQVLEIKNEIRLVQADTVMPDDMKERMIRNLEKEIEGLRHGEAARLDGTYLLVDSYRGLATLESNIVPLTIQ